MRAPRIALLILSPPLALIEAQAPLRVGALVASRTADKHDDEFTLNRPAHMTKAGDTLIVADRGNFRVVLFEASTLRPLARFGVEGSGPGEFRRVRHVQVTPMSIIASDETTLRLNVFSRAGKFAHVEELPESGSPEAFAILGDGSAITASRSQTHFLQARLQSSPFKPFGARANKGDIFAGHHGNLVIAGRNNEILTIDNDSGAVVVFDQRGNPLRTWPIPRVLRDEVLRTRAGFRTNAPAGTRVFFGYPVFVAANLLPNGDLFLYHRLIKPTIGYVLNTTTGAFRRMLGAISVGLGEDVRSAYFDGTRLYVLHDDGVRVFSVSADR